MHGQNHIKSTQSCRQTTEMEIQGKPVEGYTTLC